MKLHKEVFPTIFFAVVIFLFFNVGMWRLFHEHPIVYTALFYITIPILFLVIYFFRVKTKISPVDETKIISPAYGKVVNIEEGVFENEYYNEEKLLVSIFLSPLDIHCQYAPMKGVVKFAKYFPGKYLVAFHPKSSELNEHASVVLENESISILVKQIAGAVARRIVPYLEEGQTVNQNDELGFIKFGSRVDIFFPKGTKLNIKVGDKVKGAETIIASL